MNAEYAFEILTKIYSRDFLMSIATQNGIVWDEVEGSEDDGWSSFSNALTEFLGESDLNFDVDEDTSQQLLELYTQARELHKQTMLPHVKSAMTKMMADKESTPDEVLPEVYKLLEEYGGATWNNKLATLNHLSTAISRLEPLGEPTGQLEGPTESL